MKRQKSAEEGLSRIGSSTATTDDQHHVVRRPIIIDGETDVKKRRRSPSVLRATPSEMAGAATTKAKMSDSRVPDVRVSSTGSRSATQFSSKERRDWRSSSQRPESPSAKQRRDWRSSSQRPESPSAKQRRDWRSSSQRPKSPSAKQRRDWRSSSQRPESPSAKQRHTRLDCRASSVRPTSPHTSRQRHLSSSYYQEDRHGVRSTSPLGRSCHSLFYQDGGDRLRQNDMQPRPLFMVFRPDSSKPHSHGDLGLLYKNEYLLFKVRSNRSGNSGKPRRVRVIKSWTVKLFNTDIYSFTKYVCPVSFVQQALERVLSDQRDGPFTYLVMEFNKNHLAEAMPEVVDYVNSLPRRKITRLLVTVARRSMLCTFDEDCFPRDCLVCGLDALERAHLTESRGMYKYGVTKETETDLPEIATLISSLV